MPALPRYAQLQAPTLMVLAAPKNGGIVPAATLTEIQATNPCLQVTTITGADHNVHRTRFAEFIAAVEPFLVVSGPARWT